ncbi:iron ABC transporter permease [Halioxenophilus sp. WMMB6]|uniref:ABC transporter permease n=1 Tax=Halioxenophilus sp. WMMB6 TaxID=3073815 RepID=UPI00295F01C9|nr:iron ABC transporter permease [Halioxenophilus sp. WMMB6]
MAVFEGSIAGLGNRQARQRSAQFYWRLPTYLVAALVLLPLSVIVLSWLDPQPDIWAHLLETQLARLLKNTLVLLLGVGVLVALVGVSLAWLVATCEFPGRRWLDWGLMLPLAIPPYVLAFVFLGLLDYSGPVNTFLRNTFGWRNGLGDVRSAPGVIVVMALVLYPYVYMLARSAFLGQGRELMDAARSLGVNPWRAFWRVALPMARPAIAAGMALALMETLADFGAVSVFNFDTFTTAIYKAWFGFYSLSAAAQLASLLLLVVLLALWLERAARRGRMSQNQRLQKQQRYRLAGGRAWLASGYCLLIFALAFAVPVAQLLVWTLAHLQEFDSRYWLFVKNSLVLAGTTSLVALTVALLAGFGQRQSQTAGIWVRIASLGYALPGSVLAVGVLLVLALIDNHLLAPLYEALGIGQLLVGSLLALVLAYLIRFYSVAFGPVQSSLDAIRPSYQEVAQTLGAGRWRILRQVYLPLLRPGLLTAALLVLVDTLKEMPATLILRPFGWDTLAVRIFERTAEGQWQQAALPAVTLVAVSLVPVIMMIRRSSEPH